MYPYIPPSTSPREWIEALKEYVEFEEDRDRKRKDKDKGKSQSKGLSAGQTFLVLTWASVVVGPLYWFIVLKMVHEIGTVIPH